MTGESFKRIEKKFWMTQSQYKELMDILESRIETDPHGESTIANIYFDTEYYDLIRRSIERPFFKEKIRLRSYGIPAQDSAVYVELKRKLDGIGYKRRAELTYSEAMKLMNGTREPASQIEREIAEFIRRYQVQPKVLLTYHRHPCYLKDNPSFRITFDTDLRYKPWKNGMVLKDDGDYIMADPDRVLLEIKTDHAIPLWLAEILNSLKIYQAPFSKIGTCYTNHLRKGEMKYAE